MLNKLFIESYIRWSGIDGDGHLHANLFYGTKSQLNDYAKNNKLLLTTTKHEIRFKKKESVSQSVHTFTNDLGAILSSGINLIDALQMLNFRYTDDHLKNVITTTLSHLHAGLSLSNALADFPNLFSASYIQLIKAAEMTNQLPLIFSQLAKQQKFTQELKNKVKKALIYPACVLLFTLFITIGLIAFAIPQFQTIFSNFNAELPAATQTILTVSQIIVHNKFLLLLIFITSPSLLYALYKKSHLTQSGLQFAILRTPWIGSLYRHKLIANWSYIMSLCVQSNIPLQQCLELANASLTHIKIKKSCATLIDLLNAGSTLYEALSTVHLFLPPDLYLIKIGETSNTLGQSLERLSTQSFTDIAHALESLSKWLEPVIMLILAVIAGGLIISMYLPIFKIGAIL